MLAPAFSFRERAGVRESRPVGEGDPLLQMCPGSVFAQEESRLPQRFMRLQGVLRHGVGLLQPVHLTGRIEHVTSRQALEFDSLEALFAFVTLMLQQEQDTSSGAGP